MSRGLLGRLSPRMLRLVLNLYPPYALTGIRIDRIDPEWRSIDVSMALRFYNRNAVGTHFGGSLYAMVDPHVMLLLMQRLGPEYVVWDRKAEIDFLKPGRGTVRCHVTVPGEVEDEIRRRTADGEPYRPVFELEIVDEERDMVAAVRKEIHVRRRGAPRPP